MKTRRLLLLSLFFTSTYVAFVGCGDDDESTPSGNTDAGNEASTVDTTPNDSSSSSDARTDARSPEFTGSACTVAADCYGDIDAAALQGGPAVCIDKVDKGYCTHECTKDEDCCAVPGECVTGLKQVCASFENTDKKYCFLSCEEEDIAKAADGGFTDAGTTDGGGFDRNEYCHRNASLEMGCRSTGGGQNNRQVCLPNATGDGGVGDGGKKDAGDAGDADANDQ